MSDITLGIPHGSVLGPVFFYIAMTYIDPKNKTHFVHFADDTTVFASNSDINNVDATVNRELVGVDNWLKTQRISLER